MDVGMPFAFLKASVEDFAAPSGKKACCKQMNNSIFFLCIVLCPWPCRHIRSSHQTIIAIRLAGWTTRPEEKHVNST